MLSDDRVVVVKKGHGSQYVIMKQKDSDVKCIEFTPNRLVLVHIYFVCIRLDIYNLNSSLAVCSISRGV